MNTRFKRRKTPTTYEELLQIDAWSRDPLDGPPRPPPKPKQPNTSPRLKRGTVPKKGTVPETVPEEWRGRGQPRKISLDDPVMNVDNNKFKLSRREVLRKLGKMWATLEEVAGFFNVHRETIRNWFNREPEARVIYEDAKLQGNISQRRRNVRLAERSAAMSIFLSKNQLGMRDDFAVSGKVDHEHTMLHVLLQELGDGTHGKVIQHDETER